MSFECTHRAEERKLAPPILHIIEEANYMAPFNAELVKKAIQARLVQKTPPAAPNYVQTLLRPKDKAADEPSHVVASQ
jgi:hypothetical protein